MLHPLRTLRWLYVGRLSLAAGLFAGAVLVWQNAPPVTTLLTTLLFVSAVAVTLAGWWHTHLRRRSLSRGFLYAQILFDVVAVTVAVHVTGGPRSEFPPLYIVVIAAGALLLPLPGGLIIGAVACTAYLADIVWLHAAIEQPTSVMLQIALFAVMAFVTAGLADRLRRTGTALGAVASQLEQLRLDTGDILQAIPTAIVTVDGGGRLVNLNGAGERLLGVRERDWRGKPFLEEVDRRAPGLGRCIERTVSTRQPEDRGEVRLPASYGSRILGVRTTLLERESAPWVTAVFQDITEGKKLEELKRRAERLEAVAALAASLAHEIKNPLASIRSATEQLAGTRIDDGDRDLLKSLVLNESDRLSRLLADFMEYSRVELRRRARFDLGELTSQAVELVTRHPDAASARIERSMPAEPVLVEGDADLLHRALFNLVLNAAQHAGSGGRVSVEVGRLAEAELPAGVRVRGPVRIAVLDSGPGIAPDDISRVFDPFFTTRKGGTGLGLAMVHRAVEAHRGTILVDPGLGRGAGFYVYLPSEA
ncbi:MAG TPA: ATP-binding protein [Longimicrobiales bacterium]|nr:ATP-binding protein [Longimicrobiales bacterium]